MSLLTHLILPVLGELPIPGELPVPLRYKSGGGNAGRVYGDICRALATPPGPIHWEDWTPGDWRLAGRIARQEGVAPLLYWTLHRIWPERMPLGMRQQLEHAWYNTTAHNTLIFAELEKILAGLAQAGIPVIVLKGGALAAILYEEIGLRPMGDLDLLIRPADLDAALAVARAQGYTLAEAEITPRLNRQISHNEYLLGGPENRIGLELHWNLIAGNADDRAVPTDWFWGQTQSALISGDFAAGKMEIPHLSPTAHLLYIAAHLVLRHGGQEERLIWFYDVDRLVRAGQVDWETLARQSSRLGWGPLTRYVLEETALYLNTPLPPGIAVKVASGEAWAAFWRARGTAVAQASPFSRTSRALGHFRLGARLRVLAALVFPSPAYMRWRYDPKPAWLWPAFYGYRWAAILGGMVRSLFNRRGGR